MSGSAGANVNLAPALIFVPEDGLDGARFSWLLGNIAAAIVAIIAVRVTRARNATDPSLTDAATAEDAAEVGITLAEQHSG